MPLKAVIFDVDGTLAETEETHRLAFNIAFAEAGKAWNWSEQDYAALLTTTGGRERITRYMAEIGLPPDPATVAAMHVRKNALYAEMVEAGTIVPRPGVERLIYECRSHGVALAIATTTSRSNLDALLRNLFGDSAEKWFAVIVTGEDVIAKKPDPEVYRIALAKLALAPSDCVAIEDTYNGLAAARAAAIATIVAPSLYSRTQDFSGAALLCNNLDGGEPCIDIESLDALLRRPGPAQD